MTNYTRRYRLRDITTIPAKYDIDFIIFKNIYIII